MKKILYLLLPATILILGISITSPTSHKVAATELTATQNQKVQNLKTRANTEITRRLASLDKLSSKISLIKKLSAAQQASFTADIQNNITDLTNLKAKIDADTDPTTLQADVKSIVDDYRIYLLYVPKIHLLAGAEVVTEITTNLTTIAAKLEARITTEQTAGKDVSALNTELINMKSNIANAIANAQNITDTVTGLTPSGYPSNKTNLQSAHDMLVAAKADIQTAKKAAQAIITGLKNLSANSTNP